MRVVVVAVVRGWWWWEDGLGRDSENGKVMVCRAWSSWERWWG